MDKLNAFFNRFDGKIREHIPGIIAETAIRNFRRSFQTKSFNGKTWKEAKHTPKKGSLMLRKGFLAGSIRDITTPNRVRIVAGARLIPYAKIHNEGGVINRAARTETFVRNRYVRGPKSKYFGGMGAFKKGKTAGKGLTFKAYKIVMPQRQFMGHTEELNREIKKAIWQEFNNVSNR
ncbi:phage virion morphogenesis protein [Pedobacter antarcticus]|uniref:phage virion morphogenesis protein n=1 Tax=Pedobacter antarcticus TaxID=34086 RepID=UPI002931A608|nr:phage virion morphogenesis protein [Pedobacter antarcticus]